MSRTSTKQRFSSLNHQNLEFFGLVPRSPAHTGLICVKTLEPNISSLGPYKVITSTECKYICYCGHADLQADRYDSWRGCSVVGCLAHCSPITHIRIRYSGNMDQISLKTSNPKCRLFFKIDQ